MEAEERDVSIQHRALVAYAAQLREEVFHLKNEMLRQTDCGCPLIAGDLAEAARLAYSPPEYQQMGGISDSMGGMLLDGDRGNICDEGIERVMEELRHLEAQLRAATKRQMACVEAWKFGLEI